MRIFAIALLLAVACNRNTSNVQRLPIGHACTTSGQCGTGKFFCDLRHANGYCRADCGKDADCPSGSVCVGAGMILGGACAKTCGGDSDCRVGEGYLCQLMATDASSPYCAAPSPMDGGDDLGDLGA